MMDTVREIQVNKKHYDWNYENIKRWRSYYNQIENILKNLSSYKDKVLEIGVGNHFIEDKLKRLNVKVTTVDFDKKLCPDYVADVTKLPFKNNYFEIVCAFEVLEHIPFEEFKIALEEMKRVSKHTILFSVPYSSYNVYFGLKIFPYVDYKDIEIKIPLLYKKHEFDGQHYWEVGKKNYPLKKIKKEIINRDLKIQYIWQPKKINQIGFCLKK